jgi:hypothetical protein
VCDGACKKDLTFDKCFTKLTEKKRFVKSQKRVVEKKKMLRERRGRAKTKSERKKKNPICPFAPSHTPKRKRITACPCTSFLLVMFLLHLKINLVIEAYVMTELTHLGLVRGR